MRPLAKDEGWFEGKPHRVGKPRVIILEAGAFLALAAARPEAAREMRRTFNVDIDEQAAVRHLDLLPVPGWRMRFGRRSSSSWRPTSSLRVSARSARRGVSPRTNMTVA